MFADAEKPQGDLPVSTSNAANMHRGDRTSPFTTLLALSEDAIWGLTSEGTISFWSPSAERLLGYTPQEAVGMSVSLLLEDVEQGAAQAIARAVSFQTGPREFSGQCVLTGKDQARHRVLLRAAPTAEFGQPVTSVLVTAHDRTAEHESARKLHQMQANAERRTVVLNTASRVALDVIAQRTGREALQHITDAARTLTNAREAVLAVARLDGSEIQDLIATPGYKARSSYHGLAATAIRASLSPACPSVRKPELLCIPIRQQEGRAPLGSLCVMEKTQQNGGIFTEEDEALLQALAAHAAVAVHHLRLLHRQRALVRGLIGAQEEERRTVAYELHDGLTQHVMAAHLHLELCHEALGETSDLTVTARFLRELNQGLEYLRQAVVESRRLVNGFRALALDDLGLVGGLEQLLEEEKNRAGWTRAELVHNLLHHRYDSVLETAVFRVAQEALTNARKHANTDRVQIALTEEPEDTADSYRLILEVQDWGVGFVPDERAGDWQHLGLHGMNERVELLGGAYELQSSAGEGTTVRATFPLVRRPPSRTMSETIEQSGKQSLEDNGAGGEA